MANQRRITLKPIRGYWHLWLVNHFQEVVSEQLDRLLDSGLYDACENIYVGCVGENEEFRILQKMLAPYPKIVISEYTTDKRVYEFQTLNILKTHVDDAVEDFYVFYFHGKGVSFSKEENEVAYTGGTYWRRSMDEWTLSRWKENIAQLDFGYETCGTQLRPKREWEEHYSGGYFWATSEYVRVVKAVGSCDLNNRMEAEFWICSSNPISATLSQEFIDYYTPKHHPPNIHIKKNRNVVHTLSYNLVSETAQATKELYAINDKNDFEHIIVDLDFPLLTGSEIPGDLTSARKQNTEALKELANKFGSKYLKIENIGVSQNWTSVAKNASIDEGDVLICADHDERVNPECEGWVKTIGDVLRKDKKLGVVSLIMQSNLDKKEFNETNTIKREVDGIKVWEVNGAAMWPQIGISGSFIQKMGGVIPFPKDFPIYGHLEAALIHYMGRYNLKWAMLPDYIVTHTDNVPLLREWKDTMIFRREELKRQVPLDEFLRMKRLGKL